MKMLIDPVKLTLPNLQQYYIYSSRLYFIDKFIWSAMFADFDDIFYKPVYDEAWK